MSARDVIDLAEAAGMDRARVGGKAQRLGLLSRLGLPTPDGFVIPADAPLPQSETLAAELIRRGWENRPLAVRSSAPHEDDAQASFAGIYLSRLDVVGVAAVLDAAKAVRASASSPRAKAYGERVGLDPVKAAAMAVLITPMVPARAAGVAFTCDPRSGRDDLMVISAVRGLGQSLVDGSEAGEDTVVAEDRVTERLSILSRRPTASATSPILDDRAVLKLAHLLRDAAQALDYGDPAFDVEWVWTGKTFVLVQARPVTGRRWNTYPDLVGQPCVWSNGNTRDVLPLVMGAMDWIGSRRLVDMILEQSYRRTGYDMPPGLRRSALLGGRLYLNVSLIQWEAYDGFGFPPAEMNALLGGHHPEILVPPPTPRQRLGRALRLAKFILRSGRWRRQGLVEVNQSLDEAAAIRAMDLGRETDRGLRDCLERLRDTTRRRGSLMWLQGSGCITLSQLLSLVRKYLPDDAEALLAAIMAGGEPSVSTRQGEALLELARLARRDPATRLWLERGPPWDLDRPPPDMAFRLGLARFLERYGHRAIYETYCRNPRFREDPCFVLHSVTALLEVDEDALASRREAAKQAAWARLDSALPWAARRVIRGRLEAARREGRHRELARSALTASIEALRLLLLEIGRRLAERNILDSPDDVFDLTPHEALDALDGQGTGLRARIRHRRVQMAECNSHPAADTVTDGRRAFAAVPSPDVNGLRVGVSVGGGQVEGIARVVHSPEQGGKLHPGDILVAPSTDPAWTPLFLRAGGLVMETGGYVSHGAIIARELGIPAVINLPGILSAIRDGQTIRVDGDRGTVQILDQPPLPALSS